MAATAWWIFTNGTSRIRGRIIRRSIYWGKYVAHDNNRDAMGVTLKLTENVLNTFVDWRAQVLHDLARICAVSVRQHGGRWSIQRMGGSNPHERMGNAGLAQRGAT